MTPRPYQAKAHDQVIEHLADNPVLTSPTGSGKTFIATRIIRTLDRRTIFLAHRRELIHQAADSLRGYGLDVGIIMAGEAATPNAQVQVASVQTLLRREPPRADLLVIDEAHHVCSASLTRLVEAYPGIPRLGLTATPFRADNRGLGSAFGRIIVAATPAELVRDGTLVEPVVYAPADPSLDGVRKRGGDYAVGELAERMGKRKLVGDVVQTWLRMANGRRTVCFAVNVAHSQSIVGEFRTRGVAAEHLDGTTSKAQRDAILYRLRTGYTTVVSQCQVLTEGWDLPTLEVAIVARPTASLCLHLQMVGRIMRVADGKAGAVVLDHAGNHLRHGVVTQALTYSLEDGAQPAASRDGEVGMKRCTACYLLIAAGSSVCPACGHEFPAVLPEVEEGELELLSKDGRPSLRDQQVIWDRIDTRRFALGFRPAWSLHEFKRQVGFKPMVRDGVVIDPAHAPEDAKRAVYEKYLRIQRERGHDPRWVGIRFKAVFGHWPRYAERKAS